MDTEFDIYHKYFLNHDLGSTLVGTYKPELGQIHGTYAFGSEISQNNQLDVDNINEGWHLEKKEDLYPHERFVCDTFHPWMNVAQQQCFFMLCDIYGGDHHVFGKVKESGENGISIRTRNGIFSTFDSSEMTRAVVMAHDRKIRFQISSSSGGYLLLSFHQRETRRGSVSRRHPSLKEAIKCMGARVGV